MVYETARDPDTVADQVRFLAGGPMRRGIERMHDRVTGWTCGPTRHDLIAKRSTQTEDEPDERAGAASKADRAPWVHGGRDLRLPPFNGQMRDREMGRWKNGLTGKVRSPDDPIAQSLKGMWKGAGDW